MPLLEINGQWISYEDARRTHSPVILAHGLLMDHAMFAPQVEALARANRIITWDARCHGETESTDDPFSYWDLAEDLKGLLDSLDIERAVIGGMGQGGFVALRFALRYPERVSAMILVGTQAGGEDLEKAATYRAMLDAWERDGLSDELAEAIGAIVFGGEWPGRLPWIAKWRQMPRSLLRQGFQALVGRDDIHDRLGEIKAPVLVIHGTADAAIEMDRAQRLCSELANCRPLVAIEGAGHACNLTHPTAVNLAVQEFLGELGLRTRRMAERRAVERRAQAERRFGERREPVRASAGRRINPHSDRRLAERRATERRQTWRVLSRA